MAEKRLLYFTAEQVSSYRWKAGRLDLDEVFPSGEEGVAAFAEYISRHSSCLYYILADVVEEDFAQDSIPALRGKDRQQLLARKIAQRYRDTSLALAMSLGMLTVGDRREEQILFSSFTNTQPFQPWLTALRSREARLVGLYSAPLVAPLVGDRLGYKKAKQDTYLLVTVEKAGLRQTFVHKGGVRFSRLGRAVEGNATLTAVSCAEESARIQQYLVSLRILSRDGPRLKTVVLAPSADRDIYAQACASNAHMDYEVLDLDDTARRCGLKSWPEGSGAEALLLHVLASSQAGQQFASDELRRPYHLWRGRVAILTVGTAAFVFCMLLAGFKMLDVSSVKQQTEADQKQEAVAQDQYARLQARFPKTPTSTDKLDAIVKNYTKLRAQTTTPEAVLFQISRALESLPQIEIDRIEWDASKSPAAGPGAPAEDAAKAAAAKNPGLAAAPATPAAGKPDETLQYATITGHIISAQSSDYRAVTRIVDQFVEGLRAGPGIQLVSRRLPFDISAGQALAGDIGAARATEVPRFTVIISKQAGAS